MAGTTCILTRCQMNNRMLALTVDPFDVPPGYQNQPAIVDIHLMEVTFAQDPDVRRACIGDQNGAFSTGLIMHSVIGCVEGLDEPYTISFPQTVDVRLLGTRHRGVREFSVETLARMSRVFTGPRVADRLKPDSDGPQQPDKSGARRADIATTGYHSWRRR